MSYLPLPITIEHFFRYVSIGIITYNPIAPQIIIVKVRTHRNGGQHKVMTWTTKCVRGTVGPLKIIANVIVNQTSQGRPHSALCRDYYYNIQFAQSVDNIAIKSFFRSSTLPWLHLSTR